MTDFGVRALARQSDFRAEALTPNIALDEP